MSTRRWLFLAPLALLAGPARAADRVQECIGEHVEAQLLRKQGRWVEAHDWLLECAQPACPELVREECAALARDVEAALPSVVLQALDDNGEPTVAPTVSIDGSREQVELDGRPIPLDPGEHHLRFVHPAGGTRDVALVLVEAEHERRVVADFRPRDDGAARGSRWPENVMFVSAGVAAVALGSFTYFALSGHGIENQLSRCKPNCDNAAEIDRMRSRYLVADVSLGIALVAVGVGAYAWTQRSSGPPLAGTSSATRIGLSLPLAQQRSLGLWATGEF